tara:strand:- start:1072 stop:1425 length:354 start_codon:yes stop_codon:yes gene_type:complete
MTLLEDIAECNKARWELARILLGERITGDIVELHKECIAEATRLLIWEYEFRLETHDWTYMMSDDPYVYKKGHAEQRWLEERASRSLGRIGDEYRWRFDDKKKRASARAGPELPSKP